MSARTAPVQNTGTIEKNLRITLQSVTLLQQMAERKWKTDSFFGRKDGKYGCSPPTNLNFFQREKTEKIVKLCQYHFACTR
jgi:hypothetical protein